MKFIQVCLEINALINLFCFASQLEEKLKKEREEQERLKLIEIQKKTPEVTITVVDPSKPVSNKFLPRKHLPEVSILPAVRPLPVIIPLIKQTGNGRKKQELGNNEKYKTTPVNSKTKNAPSCDKVDGIVSSSQNNKVKSKAKNNVNVQPVNISTNLKSNNTRTVAEVAPATHDMENLTKKQRKKLKREIARLEAEKANNNKEVERKTENQPQIVTIKRIMESNSVEPTVTITLKGQTPAEDKVLFTLINGQTKEPEKGLNSGSGKKKKSKSNTQTNNQNQAKQQQQSQQFKQKNVNVKPTSTIEKNKGSKNIDGKLQQQVSVEKNNSLSKKKDKKNGENKENVVQQQQVNQQNPQSSKNKTQQQQNIKKQNKANSQNQSNTLQQKQQAVTGGSKDGNSKKNKVQQQQQPQNSAKQRNEENLKTSSNEKHKANKDKKNNAAPVAKQPTQMLSKQVNSANYSLSNQLKDISANAKINIENLKLPPGITITKVDAPVKPIPIKSAAVTKPANPPKQTTIIAAPMSGMMSGMQPSYASAQGAGNVIVVDTGKLKQDLGSVASNKGENFISYFILIFFILSNQ